MIQSITSGPTEGDRCSCHLEVVNLETGCATALLQLPDAVRLLLLAEGLGDKWTLAQSGDLIDLTIRSAWK